MIGRDPRGFARVLVVLSLFAAGACGGDGPPDGREKDRANAQESPPSIAADLESSRRYQKLKADQPGGPRHREAVSAEPTRAALDDAASGGPTRRDAEAFAILVNHALEDQTDGARSSGVDEHLSPDLPADSRAAIEQSRNWPGTRIIPGSRSYVRSRADGVDPPQFRVQLVEQVEVPAMADESGKPNVGWGDNLLIVSRTPEGWTVIDYQRSLASEYEEFSPYTWAGAMDSGRSWRRVRVGP